MTERGALRHGGDKAAMAIIVALVVLRLCYVFTSGVDSDEPQNLHVVFMWLQGQLPYRDQFDNHTPLLHLIFLPFAALFGETANIVLLARLAILPLSFGILAVLYCIFRALFDRSVALWSLAITLALADWSLTSIEFRPDILWAFLWFLALALLVKRGRRSGPETFFGVGVLLGAAAATSVKTAYLIPSLAISLGWIWLVAPSLRLTHPARRVWLCALAAALGLALIPGAVAAYFAWNGAFGQMLFCIYRVNAGGVPLERSLLFFAGLPFALWVASRIARGADVEAPMRAVVFLATALYGLAILGFTPIEALAKQTFLPVYPMLIGFACFAGMRLPRTRSGLATPVAALACGVLALTMLVENPPWRDGGREQRELLREVIALTHPGDFLMDLKGETIFRPRPVYMIYVGITKRAIEEGRLADANPSALSATETAFACGNVAPFPGEGMKEILKRNYLPVGSGALRAVGRILKPSWEEGSWIERVPIQIPGDYVLLRDGKWIADVHLEKADTQVFDFGTERGPRTLLWKPAWEAGFRPLASLTSKD